MTSDFRTASAEKKIRSRISYLEQLERENSAHWDEDEKIKHEQALADQHALLQQLQDEIAEVVEVRDAPDAPSVTVPLPDLPHAAKPSYPVYVPAAATLQKWRFEAKAATEAYGDHNDHPRRTLVLLELVTDLMRILAEEGVKLDPAPKPDEDRGAFPLGRPEPQLTGAEPLPAPALASGGEAPPLEPA